MKLWGLGLAIIASACTVNGKAFGPGSGGSTTPSSGGNNTSSNNSSSSGNTSGFDDGPRTSPTARFDKLPPYSAAPADPWVAVSGDQPKRWAEADADHWVLRGNEWDCSAAHDHCIDKDAWFVVRNSDLERHLPAGVSWEVFGPDGTPASAVNGRHYGVGSETDWTAFRTVPATKANIAVGTAVIALDRASGKLTSAESSHDASWMYGFVDSVDTDGGFFQLKNHNDVFKLWGARVVVLTWKPGGKVEIVGGKKRNELAVKASDTFRPE